MDRWKAELGRGREKRRVEERKSEKRKSQKKEDADARKGRKVAKHYVFQMICGSGGSKSRLAKAVGAEPAGQMRHEKVHAVVARSTFRSQNVQNTPMSDHFWKLRCRKSARRCGAKYVSKSKYTKHTIVGSLLEVEMSKKCTPLWREHISKSKCENTPGSDHFWKLRCRKSARRYGAKHISKSKCTKHTMFGPLLEVQMSFRMAGARDCAPCQKSAKREGFVAFSTTTTTTPHDTPIHYTTPQLQLHLHYIPLHYTPPTTLHYTQLHSITLNYTTLQYITLHYLPLHYITLHSTTTTTTQLHLHYTHYTPLHWITLHDATLQYITLHYTTLH